ncbi:hypothetical protein [Shewanella algae]|uniref:hypothetical protein n=1 Tax=Shewanella algae TaxID=38313 RepID=UPI0031F511EE
MMNLIFKIAIYIIGLTVCAANASPVTESWKLGSDTKQVLYVVPDLGTRIIFPFMLTDEALNPRLSVVMTNPAYYTVPDTSKEIDANVLQNTLTIMVSRETILSNIDGNGRLVSPLLGYLYLSVGGLNLTVELRATLNVSQAVANVKVDISNEKREYLIAETVKRKTESLEADYKKRLKSLDIRADEMALSMVGEMAWTEPNLTRVRDDFKLTTDTGHRLEIAIDDFKTYDTFTTLKLHISNSESKPIHISDVGLYRSAEQRRAIMVYHQCNNKIQKYQEVECVLTTREKGVASVDNLILRVDTDKGAGEIKW